jgi:hypothetical protein
MPGRGDLESRHETVRMRERWHVELGDESMPDGSNVPEWLHHGMPRSLLLYRTRRAELRTTARVPVSAVHTLRGQPAQVSILRTLGLAFERDRGHLMQ